MSEACRSCGAPVLWYRHVTTGRWAPINAEPDPAGNLLLYADRRYAVEGRDVELTPGHPAPRHTSHYATCPQAGAWRAGRGR